MCNKWRSAFRYRNQDLFTTFLDLLNVKYTNKHTEKLYNEHPYKYSFYGLSDMLAKYNVLNIGVRFADKEKVLDDIGLPFFAHIHDDIVIVSWKDSNTVKFFGRGREIVLSRNDFINQWTGEAILAEKGESACEPNYMSHYKESILKRANGILLVVLCLLAVMVMLLRSEIDIWKGIALFCYAVGVVSSLFLVMKQIKVNNGAVDRICSLLLPQSKCGDVLDSNASKIFKVFSWSNVGLSYFISGIITILFFPYLYGFGAIVNILSLPYTIWSIWYQKTKAKQWCSLCLVVQAMQWVILFCNISGQMFIFPPTDLIDLVVLVLIWTIPFLAINTCTWSIEKSHMNKNAVYNYNHLRNSKAVFNSILHQQKRYAVSLDNSHVVIGNVNAPITITVFTNPHCQPCAILHEKIDKLLEERKQTFRVQYIFTSFNEELSISCKILISACLYHPSEFRNICNDWYSKGKYNVEEFSKKYNCDPNLPSVIEEYKLHEQWRINTKLSATPTILVDGFQLPPEYQIEDLRYVESID